MLLFAHRSFRGKSIGIGWSSENNFPFESGESFLTMYITSLPLTECTKVYKTSTGLIISYFWFKHTSPLREQQKNFSYGETENSSINRI